MATLTSPGDFGKMKIENLTREQRHQIGNGAEMIPAPDL